MPLLPYCIVNSEANVKPPDAGVRGGVLQSLEEGGLRCFFSEVEGAPKTSEEVRADALSFQETVQNIFAQATVIPFRFVTLLEGEEELHDFLEDHAEQYGEALDRLQGLEQYEMRMKQAVVPDAGEPETGAEYLKKKLAASAAVGKASDAPEESGGRPGAGMASARFGRDGAVLCADPTRGATGIQESGKHGEVAGRNPRCAERAVASERICAAGTSG